MNLLSPSRALKQTCLKSISDHVNEPISILNVCWDARLYKAPKHNTSCCRVIQIHYYIDGRKYANLLYGVKSFFI